jgi:hypothetical protein
VADTRDELATSVVTQAQELACKKKRDRERERERNSFEKNTATLK